ncbi:lauroyl acyltransferase [Cognatishimia sp. SS12]|uniref:lysophospholipid acyltransferase family protein n=1 Tax=Cognatishimia sp. SS12 TaxID=2979465 RepID=UPI00232F5F63|nr:lauroyl acyltransferase [Cognatishimia sp. SS12]MDC0739212.1 lauroyl acyltransferase [Cognatishimia sp. SS12]
MTKTDTITRPVAFRDRVEYAAIRSILGVFHVLPYRARVGFLGWIMERVIGPLAGYNKRTRENLALVMPEMPHDERETLVRKVSNNVGRTLAEMFSPDKLVPLARESEFAGLGLATVDAARAAGKPCIFISGHFGNYDVGRAALIARGFDVGGLYRKMNNPLFHTYYVDKISTIGTPLFERGRPGLGQMLRHIRGGGSIAALIDLRAGSGAPLTFFGKRAWTALSMAEMAIKYDALLVPTYSVRQPDGISYKIIVEEPVPHSDPETMTQALNDSLEARVRAHMDQWFWVHRRWKDI